MSLTPEQIERLRDWAAGKMGWATIWQITHPCLWAFRKGTYYDATKLPENVPVMSVASWHPETSLDQAVMVADKVGVWELGAAASFIGPYWARSYGNLRGYREADNPATALLLACAKAGGFEVGENE